MSTKRLMTVLALWSALSVSNVHARSVRQAWQQMSRGKKVAAILGGVVVGAAVVTGIVFAVRAIRAEESAPKPVARPVVVVPQSAKQAVAEVLKPEVGGDSSAPVDKTTQQIQRKAVQLDKKTGEELRDSLRRLMGQEMSTNSITLPKMRIALIDAGKNLQKAHVKGDGAAKKGAFEGYQRAEQHFKAVIHQINTLRHKVWQSDEYREGLSPEQINFPTLPKELEQYVDMDMQNKRKQTVNEEWGTLLKQVYPFTTLKGLMKNWPGRKEFWEGRFLGSHGLKNRLFNIEHSSEEWMREQLAELEGLRKKSSKYKRDNGTLPCARRYVAQAIDALQKAHDQGDKEQCIKLGQHYDKVRADFSRVVCVAGITRWYVSRPYLYALTPQEIAWPAPPKCLQKQSK